MASAEQQPLALALAPHRRRQHPIATTGAVALLVPSAILLLIDWRHGIQMARSWFQLLFVALGATSIISAFLQRASSRLQRVLIAAGGLLVLLAVYASLDGQQDVLTEAVMLLALWGLIFGSTTAQLLRSGAPTTRRQRLAAMVGVLATLAYAGAAGYGMRMGLAGHPVTTIGRSRTARCSGSP